MLDGGRVLRRAGGGPPGAVPIGERIPQAVGAEAELDAGSGIGKAFHVAYYQRRIPLRPHQSDTDRET